MPHRTRSETRQDERGSWIRPSLDALVSWYLRIRGRSQDADVPEITSADLERAQRDRCSVTDTERKEAARAAQDALARLDLQHGTARTVEAQYAAEIDPVRPPRPSS